jgi:hypothetical protein
MFLLQLVQGETADFTTSKDDHSLNVLIHTLVSKPDYVHLVHLYSFLDRQQVNEYEQHHQAENIVFHIEML